jgi:hypothetical protein
MFFTPPAYIARALFAASLHTACKSTSFAAPVPGTEQVWHKHCLVLSSCDIIIIIINTRLDAQTT